MAVRGVDDAGELANIPGPVVGFDRGGRLGGETAAECTDPLVGPLQQMLCEERQVVPAPGSVRI